MKSFLHSFGKKLLLLFFIVIPFFSIVQNSLAISITEDPCGGNSCLQAGIDEEKLPEELRNQDGEGLKEKIISVINYILTFLGIALLIVIIYAGSLLIFSNGDDEAVGKAKTIILYAILGVVIIVLSYAIVTWIGNIMSDKDGSQFTGEESGGGSGGSSGGGSGVSGGDTPGSQGSGNAELEAKIEKLIEEMNALKEQNAEQNADSINALQEKIDELEKQINNPNSEFEDALKKQIEDLTAQIKELENKENPDDNTVIDELQKELDALQDKINSSSSDTESELTKLLSQISKIEKGGILQNSEIKKLQEILQSLQNQSKGNPSLEEKYKELERFINELSGKVGENVEGQDSVLVKEVIKNIEKEITQTQEFVKKMSEVRARIIMNYARKSVPTTISLSGEKTYIKGLSKARLVNDNYHWAVVGPDGIKINIGNGISQEYEIKIPGKYVFFLNVDSPAEDVISGEAIQSFTAKSQDMEVAFLVGEKTSRETLKFTAQENKQGLIFNPSLVRPKSGRKIIRYLWNFDGYKVEETEGKPVLYSFSETGKHRVSLTVTDNTGEWKKSKTIALDITQVVSYFSLKNKKYKVGKPIPFSASKSKSDNGFIQEFDWKILNSKNELVKEFQDEKFSYSFSSPGDYIVILTVTDVGGESSSSSSNISIVAESSSARFTIEKPSSTTPALRLFDASKSTDPANSSLLYAWDFDNDGIYELTEQTDPIITHLFEESKEYDVTLRVTNEFGKESFITKSVNISSVLTAEIEIEKVVYPVNTDIPFIAKTNEGVAFEWNFGDGKGKETTGDEKIIHSFEKSGQYTVSLTVNDKNGNKTSAKKNIFIGTVESPIAAISIFVNNKKQLIVPDICGSGKNGIEIFRSDSLELSAENSINKDGKPQSLDYIWEFPENSLENGKTQTWAFLHPSKKGECEEVQLRVEDLRSGKSSAKQKVYFFVKNSSPKISEFIISPPSKKIAPVIIPLKIKAKDRDGKISKYSWWAERKGGGNKKISFHTTQNSSTTLTIPSFGSEGEVYEYTFHSAVEDNDGDISTTQEELGKSISIKVETGKNKAPKVNLVLDKKSVLMGESILFTAHVENSEGEDISHLATYKWDFDGDNIFDTVSSKNSILHKYMIPGNVVVKVKVLFQGLSTSKTEKISVGRISKLPLAQFSFQKNEKGEIVFNASSSKYDQTISGNAIKYSWDFDISQDSDGDGISDNDIDSTEQIAIYRYPVNKKEVEVSLSVSDATSKSDTLSQKIQLDLISGVVQTNNSSSGQKISLSSLFQRLRLLLQSENPEDEDINTFENDLKKAIDDLKSNSSEENKNNQDKLKKLLDSFLVWKDGKSSQSLESLQDELFTAQKELSPESAPLLSDKSIEGLSKLLQELESEVENLETENITVFDENGDVSTDISDQMETLEKDLESIGKDIEKDNPLYAKLQESKEYLKKLKQKYKKDESLSPEDQEKEKNKYLESVKENLKSLKQSIQDISSEAIQSSQILWKPLNELGENINKSLMFDFSTPATTLDLYGGEKYVQLNEEIEIFIFTRNADGTFYSGPLEMKVVEGEGVFTPKNKVKSIEGRGVVTFTPTQSGITLIEIIAPETVSGSLSESLTFFVQN